MRFGDLHLLAAAPTVPTLVVHDRGDARVPVRDGIAITKAWPQARLIVTDGLGHHRILRCPEVIRETGEHLTAAAAPNSRRPSRLQKPRALALA